MPSKEKIADLSRVLNRLPIFTEKPDADRFRNENGVKLKLSNFLHYDPAYRGAGMRGGGKLDETVLLEFYNRREELRTIAANIRAAVSDPELNSQLYRIRDEEVDESLVVHEGQVLYRLHKLRERNALIVKRKKDATMKKHAKLACEVCGFTFSEVYGTLGNDFIECHHRTPLSVLQPNTKTQLDDLALVCANCHRMLHRGMGASVTDLRLLVEQVNAGRFV